MNNIMHLPWQEEQSACGKPGHYHGLPEFNVDLVTLDKPSGSSEGAGTTLALQRKVAVHASGEPGFSSLGLRGIDKYSSSSGIQVLTPSAAKCILIIVL